MVHGGALAGWAVLPALRLSQYPVRHRASDHDASVPRLPEAAHVLAQDRDGDAGLAAIYLVATNLKGVSSMKLHRDLGIGQKSAWYLAHRIREAWKEVGDPFAGPVEADEAYIGGKRKNMPKSRREAMKGAGSLAGKTIVAGAKDRRTNKVSAAVVEGMDGWTLQSFVEDRVIADAKVYTDEHASWLGLIFHDHESVNHSKGEYVRGDAGTQGIESFWAMLKRAHTGTFHKISPKHMDRYVTEFAGRHNDRQADTLDQMGNIVRGMIGRRISYSDLTAS